jgi:hypothetical protein
LDLFNHCETHGHSLPCIGCELDTATKEVKQARSNIEWLCNTIRNAAIVMVDEDEDETMEVLEEVEGIEKHWGIENHIPLPTRRRLGET